MPHVLILFIFKHYKQVSDDQVTTCQKCSILRKSFAILFFNEERKIIDTLFCENNIWRKKQLVGTTTIFPNTPNSKSKI